MNAVIIGAAIVVFAALKAGFALWTLTGRPLNRKLKLAWPPVLLVAALAVLFALIPRTDLLEQASRDPALIGAGIAVTLVCLLPLAREARQWWHERRAGT